MKSASWIVASALLMLVGAGCSSSTQMSASSQTPSTPSEDALQAEAAYGAAWLSEDINTDIQAAQQFDMKEQQRDKQEYDTQLDAQGQGAIETPESEGITFEE